MKTAKKAETQNTVLDIPNLTIPEKWQTAYHCLFITNFTFALQLFLKYDRYQFALIYNRIFGPRAL